MHRILFLLAFLLTSPLLGEAFLFVGYNDQPCSYAPSRDITVTYNHLDLPVTISWNGQGQQRLEMTYDASGTLLTRESFNSGGTAVEKRDYVGGIEYVDGVLESVAHQEGRVFYGTGSERWDYALTDHLGNTRLLYSDLNGDGIPQAPSEIVQEAHYLPFGLEMTGPWMGAGVADDTKYGYNGIEKVDDFDLNVNMAFYRTLDPTIGRWWQVDPKAESFTSVSPYNSMLNSPMVHEDPDGDFAVLAGLTNGFRDLFSGGNFFEGFGRGFSNSIKMSAGLFAWDGSKGDNLFENIAGNLFDIGSRLTWQAPQTFVGQVIGQSLNVGTLVNNVEHFRGATVVDSKLQGGAFTPGNMIIGPEGFRPDFRDHLFVHEFGHYLQSKVFGPGFLFAVALPSVTDFVIVDGLFGQNLHDTRWYETDANRRTVEYFDREFGAAGFDRNSYLTNGVNSPYVNPRNGGSNRRGFSLQSQFHWTDIPINGIWNGYFGLLGYL